MNIQTPIIDQTLEKLDRETQEIITKADTAEKNKFTVSRPSILWATILTVFAIMVTLMAFGIVQMLLHPKPSITVEEIITGGGLGLLFLVITFVLDRSAYKKLKSIHEFKTKSLTYYLYVGQDYLIERANSRISLFPKDSLIYAYEDYGPLSPHIAYKDTYGQPQIYEFMNCEEGDYKYRTIRKQDLQKSTNIKRSGFVYKINDLIGLPSPIRKSIMKKYNLTLPKDMDMIDKDEYDEEPPKPLTI